jgi:hypothetical protein
LKRQNSQLQTDRLSDPSSKALFQLLITPLKEQLQCNICQQLDV